MKMSLSTVYSTLCRNDQGVHVKLARATKIKMVKAVTSASSETQAILASYTPDGRKYGPCNVVITITIQLNNSWLAREVQRRSNYIIVTHES